MTSTSNLAIMPNHHQTRQHGSPSHTRHPSAQPYPRQRPPHHRGRRRHTNGHCQTCDMRRNLPLQRTPSDPDVTIDHVTPCNGTPLYHVSWNTNLTCVALVEKEGKLAK